MDLSDHVAEISHADVHARRIPKQTIVEVLLMLFGVVGRVPNRSSILLLGVAAPHHIDWLLARQVVVSPLQIHCRVAHINTSSVVSALTVAVSQQTYLSCIGDDTLNFDANFVFGTLSFLIVQWVVVHLLIKGWIILVCGATEA